MTDKMEVHDKIQSVLHDLNDLNHEMRTTINRTTISTFRSYLIKLHELIQERFSSDELIKERLISAKILDENGHYHPDFFSEETVAKSKEKKID